MTKFDYSLDFKQINFRDRPELYRVGKGEQGVLLVEPYKSEILPYWRFKNPEIATESSSKIYDLFLNYLEQDDFVGADMARKFLQMGYTRSRRYANHKSGKKYKTNPQKAASKAEENKARQEVLPLEVDPVKARSAEIFKDKWQQAKANTKYQRLLKRHKQQYETKSTTKMGQKQIRKGSSVSWDWGNGTAEGKVQEIHRESITKTIKGNEVTRKGTEDNPAYLIQQEDGTEVLKLRSELNEGS